MTWSRTPILLNLVDCRHQFCLCTLRDIYPDGSMDQLICERFKLPLLLLTRYSLPIFASFVMHVYM